MIVLTGFNRKRRLADGRHADLRRQYLGYAVNPAQPLQSSHGQHDGVRTVGFFQFLQPGVYIPSNARKAQIRPVMLKLRPPPRTPRGDQGARWELVEARAVAADQGVPHVHALRHRGDRQSFGKGRGQVLQTVNGHVDLSRDQGPFQFLDEDALAAEGVQGGASVRIALRLEDAHLHGQAVLARFQVPGHRMGLDEGQPAAAGAYDQ